MNRPLNYLSNLVEVVPPTEEYQEGLYTVINHSLCHIKYSQNPQRELPKGSWTYLTMDELVVFASTPEVNFQFLNGKLAMTIDSKGTPKYIFKLTK